MKLVIAIISNDDCPVVLDELSDAGFRATKLSTSGGFLRAGNSTLLIGVEKEKVDSVISIIGEFSSTRKTMVAPMVTSGEFSMASTPIEVNVGGATVFVVDVDQFYRL